MGTAHAGHDQCAHCYFSYIKPALQAERKDVKSRRALKRRLSAANRQLISEVDLKEPQLRVPDSIRNAIYEIELDRLIENKTEEEAHDAVVAELQKNVMHDFGLTAPIPVPKQPQKEEPPVQETVPAPILTRHPHKGSESYLTPDQVAEVADAYIDGMAVMDICNACNIVTTTLYAILRERGIALRGRPKPAPLPFAPPQRRRPVGFMPQSTSDHWPTSANGRISDLPEWLVTYTIVRTETISVAARDFNSAAAAARTLASTNAEGVAEELDIEVLSVARKRS